jgi:hypothetical protein
MACWAVKVAALPRELHFESALPCGISVEWRQSLCLFLSHFLPCLPCPSALIHSCCRMPLRLSLTFSLLEGTMCAWVPPPPGNRLFYAFVTPPHLELTARPEVGQSVLGSCLLCMPWLHSIAAVHPTFCRRPPCNPACLPACTACQSLRRLPCPALNAAPWVPSYACCSWRVASSNTATTLPACPPGWNNACGRPSSKTWCSQVGGLVPWLP